MNTPIGLFGLSRPGARGLDALGDHLHGVVLADHALGQAVGQLQDGLDLVARHAAHRDAGPVAHHLATAW
jgi:hypothetical protein